MRVASIPRSHTYTRHIGWPGDGVERIVAPAAAVRASDLIDPSWVRQERDAFACVHTHFGFGDVDLSTLRAWRDALREVGRPLVHTVHDLANPHLPDQAHHWRQLDVLVGEADAVVTLTQAAADEVERRWNRRALVVPHPHIVRLDRLDRPRPKRPRPVVGIHLKDLRAALHGPELCEVVARVAPAAGCTLRIDVYPAAVERRPEVGAALRRLGRLAGVDLQLRPYTSDTDFEDYLRQIDVAVLPYRWGTHSGWAEACLDAGTQVIAPAGTCIPSQHPWVQAIDLQGRGMADRLGHHLDLALRRLGERAWTATGRAAQRRSIAAAHGELYRRLVASGPGATAAGAREVRAS